MHFNKTAFYKSFKSKEDVHLDLDEIILHVPDIGNVIFKSSYSLEILYIAWYKAFLELGMTKEEANRWIWLMNENYLKASCKWNTEKGLEHTK